MGDLSMHYVDEGTGQPVLMVHGNPTWSFYYRSLIKALRADYRAVAPDHIGCGRSDKPAASDYRYTLSRRVDDLTRLVDDLELERVHLVVHDWGGMIGMAWAVAHPERVDRIVLLNTAAFPLPAVKRMPVSLRLARVPGLGAALVRSANAFSRGANRFCTTKPMTNAAAAGYLAPYGSWADRVAVHEFVRDIPLSPADPAWQIVASTADRLELLADHPTAIFWGMKDFVFDHHFLAEWRRRCPKAQVTEFSDAGHYVLEDAGDFIVPAVAEFLAAA
jgi:haloalkane dehalogenase